MVGRGAAAPAPAPSSIRLVSSEDLADQNLPGSSSSVKNDDDHHWKNGHSDENRTSLASVGWDALCAALRRQQSEPNNGWRTRNFPLNISQWTLETVPCSPGEAWLFCDDQRRLVDGGDNSSCVSVLTMESRMPQRYAYFIYGVLFPVLVTLAIVANVFVLLVLSRRHMRSPTNVVLLYMAVADLFVGIVPLPYTFYWFTLGWYATPWRLSTFGCYAFHYLMDALPSLCHNVANWLTVLLAAQRYVYIEFPVRAQTLCTVENVRRASVLVLFISVLCGSMRIGDQNYKSFTGWFAFGPHLEKVDGGGCAGTFADHVNWIGADFYYTVYFWTRVCLFVWLPSVVLICLNILLIRAIHSARRRRDRLLSESRKGESSRQKESNNTSKMLVIIVSIFLLVNLPQGFVVALITAENFGVLAFSDKAPLVLLVDNMLILATYPLNFAIYCSMSAQFRNTFCQLFGKHGERFRRAASYSSYASVENGASEKKKLVAVNSLGRTTSRTALSDTPV